MEEKKNNENLNLKMKIKENKNVFYNIEKIEGIIIVNPISFLNIQLFLYKIECWKRNDKIILEKKTVLNKKIIEMINTNSKDFIFEIPKNINPSFEFPGLNNSFYIRYYLCAKLMKEKELFLAQKLIMIKTISQKNQNLNLNFGGTISKFFLSKGFCNANVSLSKNNFKVGEYIEFSIDIDNKTKYDISYIKVCLFRHIKLKGLNNLSEDLKLNKIYINVFIGSGEKNNYTFKLKFSDDKLENICMEKWKNPYQDIEISDLMNSITSDIIECKYSLKLTIYFNSFVNFGSRPRIYIPINIFHKNYDDYDENYNKKNNYQNNKNSNKIFDISDMSIITINENKKKIYDFVEKDEETILNLFEK